MATHTYALSINYNAGGQFCTNVVHYDFDDSGYATTTAAADALIAGFNTNVKPALALMLPTATTFLSAKARAIHQPGGFESAFSYAPGTTGARAGALSVSGVGPCLVFIPGGNAKERGRMFLPGVTDSDMQDGFFTPAFIAVVVAQAATVITPFTLAGGTTPVASLVIAKRAAPFLTRIVSHVLLCEYPATIRRRQIPA